MGRADPPARRRLRAARGLVARAAAQLRYHPTRGGPPDIALSVRDLVVCFARPDGDGFATVVVGVTFDVLFGETLVIMGGWGYGKTTLLNALIGELAADAGVIRYNLPALGPRDLTPATEAQADALRKRIGILVRSGALFSSLTPAENVALPRREHSHVAPAIIDIVVAIKLQQVRMLPHRDKFPAQLSGGHKKTGGPRPRHRP